MLLGCVCVGNLAKQEAAKNYFPDSSSRDVFGHFHKQEQENSSKEGPT